MTTLRVLSYNVRSLRDDPDAVVRVIRAAEPDVACVQEAPRWWRWRSRCAAMARRSDLLVAAGGRPAGGNLLLCRLSVAVRSHSAISLSPAADSRQRRGAAVAVCSLAQRPFALVGTHLDLNPNDRLRHVNELVRRLPDLVGDDPPPLILAGDVNEESGGPAFGVLAGKLQDAGSAAGGTFPAREPRRRIDAIFVDRALRIVSAEVIDAADVRVASDHRPVLAEIDLG